MAEVIYQLIRKYNVTSAWQGWLYYGKNDGL